MISDQVQGVAGASSLLSLKDTAQDSHLHTQGFGMKCQPCNVHISPVCLQYFEVTVEDDDAGPHPGDAEQHPVEEYVGWVLTEIVYCGRDEISLVSVSVTS